MGCGNDEDVADAGLHQRTDGVIHHGLVIDGHELLAHGQGERVQARAGAPGQYDSFHGYKDGENRTYRGNDPLCAGTPFNFILRTAYEPFIFFAGVLIYWQFIN